MRSGNEEDGNGKNGEKPVRFDEVESVEGNQPVFILFQARLQHF